MLGNKDNIIECLKDMQKDIQKLLIEVSERPTRSEIEKMLDTKVNVELFNSELKGIREDIKSLKGASDKTLSRTAIVISIIVGIISLLPYLLPHWK